MPIFAGTKKISSCLRSISKLPVSGNKQPPVLSTSPGYFTQGYHKSPWRIKPTACDQNYSNYLTTKSWIIPPPLPRTEPVIFCSHKHPEITEHSVGSPPTRATGARCARTICSVPDSPPTQKGRSTHMLSILGDSTAFSRTRSTTSRSQTTASFPLWFCLCTSSSKAGCDHNLSAPELMALPSKTCLINPSA